ncbi:Glutamyl-tRNA reductase [Pseudonocardia sp. Ae168_Ps1]|uniref:glutamyl-tRNA reductase n=1 Tax=unclassified Pseudonocardia TaxID=2619320 RepID=UPI0001FFDF92|nr:MULTISPECIES: glutamyl-tRNA reductase [unclassified Pseudonocardia]ALL75360.1 glutamyl-tRNA reductase [Pseudonocardia sp. EC080610-09]ALL82385.1 glutamyl-tRNA reductase [Pseudonocardia sp. EC080619-01]OLL74287.1 Glutamyl-tRNA reductase [Pseudonocardia sp. Ae150A_Ps1]OLL80268.1 Glutamyl-tRNA reductase [Pseudonocardia sp. Ae168_Ps1]OLL85605.1 Glutamyl-tRNA reductase [Pseudonocardia sp. Ae263_Ps1]
MSVLVVGLSHRSAPVEVLERLAVAPGDVPKLLEEMLDRTHVEEAVLLSTCNRIEICAVVDAFHGGLGDVTDVLGGYAGFPIGELSDHLFVHYAGSAVQHLFQLAAGLDSMVVGESQILGQLRSAYATADESGSVGKVLHELVQQALRVGKRVHAGTGIDEAGASVVSEALRDADRELGGTGLDGTRAVIVGAGAMGALAAAHLRRAGASEIVVLNRSAERGERLVEKVLEQGTAARSAPMEDLAAELRTADLMLACTGAIGHVVDAGPVAEALSGAGRERPLVVCDLGLPRDVDPAVADLPGVRVVDLITLQRRLLDATDGGSVAAAQKMVDAEAQQYLAGQRSAEVTPTVTALRRRASEVVDAELLRLDGRLPDLDGDVREELSRTVRRVVDKLLHTPTVQVKRLAEGPDGDSYAAALRTLFELDPQAAAAVAAPVRGSDATVDGNDVTAALNAPVDGQPSLGSRPPEQIS